MLREFRAPEGVGTGDMDADGDGELLVVLDMRQEEGLAAAGLARELVNRVQKARLPLGLFELQDSIYFAICQLTNLASHAGTAILCVFYDPFLHHAPDLLLSQTTVLAMSVAGVA